MLFVIAKLEKSKCLSVGDWLLKLWHIHTIEYRAAIKMIEFGLYDLTWENVHDVFLNKESRLMKNTNSIIKILIILVCIQISEYLEGYVPVWETLRKIPHALRPSHYMNSMSLIQAICA